MDLNREIAHLPQFGSAAPSPGYSHPPHNNNNHHTQPHQRSRHPSPPPAPPGEGMEEVDPSTLDGHKVVYDREVPFELRAQDTNQRQQDVGTFECLKVKVLVQGEHPPSTQHSSSGPFQPISIRLELSSEQDLFFHHTCNINQPGFRNLQAEQKLTCDFRDFQAVLIRMLNRCINESQTFFAVLILMDDGGGVLEFVQNMEYKFIELLALPFAESPEAVVRQHITYRYSYLRSKLAAMKSRMSDVNALVKIKNPQLLVQLQQQQGGSLGSGGSAVGHSQASQPPTGQEPRGTGGPNWGSEEGREVTVDADSEGLGGHPPRTPPP